MQSARFSLPFTNVAAKTCLAIALTVAAALVTSHPAHAQERSTTVRQTELKSTPDANSRIVAPLAQNAEVTIVKRDANWVRVQANGREGWVPATHLKQAVTVIEQAAPTGGFLSWFSQVLRTDRPQMVASRRAQTATIGIRGMDDGSVAVSKFNSEELQKLKLYSLSRNDAEEFARNAQLSAQSVAYFDANGQPESRGK
jgi:uncharacterized protein YgiM (DUF1202 family)